MMAYFVVMNSKRCINLRVEIMNSNDKERGNLVTRYKFAFAVRRKRDASCSKLCCHIQLLYHIFQPTKPIVIFPVIKEGSEGGGGVLSFQLNTAIALLMANL